MQKELYLVEPDVRYKNSFEKYVNCYRNNDIHYYDLYKDALVNFEVYLKTLKNRKNGIALSKGDIATSTYWLIAKEEVVGVFRLRHQEDEFAGHIGYDISPEHRNRGYGQKILKFALEKAVDFGLKEVILTCNTENVASKKIIEKSKGEYLGDIFDEEENEHLYRYRISLEE